MATRSGAILSPRTLGDLNRGRVLRALVERGPSSRSDLARAAGVTAATIGTIVQGLLDDGLLQEGEPTSDGRVGKPARPLWFAEGAGSVAALSLRVGGVAAALVDAAGRRSHPVWKDVADPANPDEVVGAVGEVLADLVARRPVIGVGISVPGSCDTATGEVFGSIQVPGAIGTGLAELVADSHKLQVRVENDTRAEALAEHWFGQCRGVDTFASIHTGAGLGAGIMVDGRVVRGPGGTGVEVGHTTVAHDGERCPCGRRGCWETLANLRWLRREARSLGLQGSRRFDAARALAAHQGGVEAAGVLLDRYADHLSLGIANLHLTLGIATFIVHGDAVGGGRPLLDRLLSAACERCQEPVTIVPSELDDAALLGAAGVVLGDLLHPVTP